MARGLQTWEGTVSAKEVFILWTRLQTNLQTIHIFVLAEYIRKLTLIQIIVKGSWENGKTSFE